jgi:hypothetical protein
MNIDWEAISRMDLSRIGEGVQVGNPILDQRQNLSPSTPSGNDALDRERGKGVYYVNPGTSSTASPPPPPPPPTPPNPWMTASTYQAPKGIKQAQPDIIIDRETDTTGDYIVERFFEELGGTELINLSRHDLIDGVKVVYNPIANLSKLRQRFNPNNIIESDFLSQNESKSATIDIISRGMGEPYFNDLGQLVVEIGIIRPEENIEVQVANSGTLTRIEL